MPITGKQLEEQNKELNIFLKTLDMLDRYFFEIARKEHVRALAKRFAADEANDIKEKEFLIARDEEELRNRHKAEAAAVALKAAPSKKEEPNTLFEQFVAAVEITVKKIAAAANAGITAQLNAGIINQAQAQAMHSFVAQHVTPLSHHNISNAVQALFKKPVKDATPELIDDVTAGTDENMHAHIRTAASLCDPARYSQDPLHYLREPRLDQPHPLKDMLLLALIRLHGTNMLNSHSIERRDILADILFSSTSAHVLELALNFHHSMKSAKVVHPTVLAAINTGVFSNSLMKHTAQADIIQSPLLDPMAKLRKPKPTNQH